MRRRVCCCPCSQADPPERLGEQSDQVADCHRRRDNPLVASRAAPRRRSATPRRADRRLRLRQVHAAPGCPGTRNSTNSAASSMLPRTPVSISRIGAPPCARTFSSRADGGEPRTARASPATPGAGRQGRAGGSLADPLALTWDVPKSMTPGDRPPGTNSRPRPLSARYSGRRVTAGAGDRPFANQMIVSRSRFGGCRSGWPALRRGW